VFFFEAAASLT